MDSEVDPISVIEDYLFKSSSRVANGLKEKGLTYLQLSYLRTIDNKGQTTVSELAKTLNLTKATISSQIKRMEDSGFVSRRKLERDKRSARIALTEKGKEICTSWRDIQASYLKRIRSHLDAKEEESLQKLLMKIVNGPLVA
jgi:DNA-binding MarR family transcriptional regulator